MAWQASAEVAGSTVSEPDGRGERGSRPAVRSLALAAMKPGRSGASSSSRAPVDDRRRVDDVDREQAVLVAPSLSRGDGHGAASVAKV
jgi:hypothetical protein